VLQDPQGNPVVHLRKLTVSGISYAPGGGLSLGGIRLDGGQMLLERLPRDSSWTLVRALAPLLEGPPSEKPLAWKIHGLRVDDLRVLVHNEHAPSWPKEAVIQELRVRELKSDATGKISLFLEQFRATDANDNRFLALSAGLEYGANGEWTLEEGRLNATGLTLNAEGHGRGADTLAVKFEARGEVSELLAWPRWFGISTDTLPQTGALQLAGSLERLLPIALGIVSELATSELSVSDKKAVAVDRLKQAAFREGVTVSASALNLIVESAVANLKAQSK
jgi:hypothetical protein